MNTDAVRADFPILSDGSYIYFDNAATTQRPRAVLEAVNAFYSSENANPLRGLYEWSVRATESYEAARHAVAELIGAAEDAEIIFTRNATESLNLIACSYARTRLRPGDEIAVGITEHHSDLLPWQMAARETGARLVFLECEPDGTYTDNEIESKIGEKTKIAAIGQVSNVLGTENPVKKIGERVHAFGGVLVVDGAQSAPHMAVDVQAMGADFFAFSGHKMLAPMGIGVLYGRRALLEEMPPFLVGGEMIETVTREGATYAELPHKFEAGTVNAGGAVGLHAAIQYINSIGFDKIQEREDHLTAYAMEKIKEIPEVHILGSDDPKEHHGILTFTVDGVHPHDIAAMMDEDHVDVRAGHHCAQPLLKFLGTMSTARASFSFYNTEEEADRLVDSMKTLRKRMGY